MKSIHLKRKSKSNHVKIFELPFDYQYFLTSWPSSSGQKTRSHTTFSSLFISRYKIWIPKLTSLLGRHWDYTKAIEIFIIPIFLKWFPSSNSRRLTFSLFHLFFSSHLSLFRQKSGKGKALPDFIYFLLSQWRAFSLSICHNTFFPQSDFSANQSNGWFKELESQRQTFQSKLFRLLANLPTWSNWKIAELSPSSKSLFIGKAAIQDHAQASFLHQLSHFKTGSGWTKGSPPEKVTPER